MIEYEKFIYLDMYKTGSTYVVSLLNKLMADKPVRSFRHAPLTKGRPFFWKKGKLAFTTVRNPWDWYVSMWAYSSEQPTELLFRDIRATFGPSDAAKFFDPANSRESFALWLKSISDPEFLKSLKSDHPYARSPLNQYMGFYSYRFMRITTPHPYIFLRRWNLPTLDAAIVHQRRWGLYDKVFKSETLTEDFSEFVLQNRQRCGFKDNAEGILKRLAPTPKNTSNRTLKSYRDYYTDELRDLVARRDRLLIELFGYEF